MRVSALLTILFAFFFFLIAGTRADAGFLDNVLNKAKQAAEEVVNDSIDETAQDKPDDKNQQVEQPGTTSTLTSSPQTQEAGSGSGLPEPSPGASMLAAVHFLPNLLDNESNLQRVLLTVHPEMQAVVSNEFQWHKRRDELKTQLLAEAKDAQLSFELRPWRDSSTTKTTPVELFKYDFDKQAYRIRFAVGTTRQVVTGMLIPSEGVPAPKYPQVIEGLAINPDKAEQIADYFGNKQRRVYLHYRVRAVGALIEATRPTSVFEFVDDQIQLFALESSTYGKQVKSDYRYLATVNVPTTATPATNQPIQKTALDTSSPPTAVIQNFEIDGVRMGMPIDEALKALTAHGYKMDAPSQPSSMTGITVNGKKATPDGAGQTKIMIRQMNGIVYQCQKNIDYWPHKLTKNISASDLQQKYHDEFVGKLSKARYSYTAPNGWMHFDDSTPPPYNSKIISPHAQVFISPVNPGQDAGIFSAQINIYWKQPVGADW